MSHETQALRNRIRKSESDIIKLRSEFEELLKRIDDLKHPEKYSTLPRCWQLDKANIIKPNLYGMFLFIS